MSQNQIAGNEAFDIINGQGGAAQGQKGISTRAFALNLALGIALFVTELTGFFLLKDSKIGRRIL